MSEHPLETDPPPRCRRVSIVCPDSPIDAACFAAALAGYLARVSGPGDRGVGPRVVLVDRQPGAGGLDVITDLESAPGARWGALRGAGSDIDGSRLLAGLPARDGVGVLSHGRRPQNISASVQGATIDALAAVTDAVVSACAPMSVEEQQSDCVILLLRGTVASLAGAEQLSHCVGQEQPIGLVALEAAQEARDAAVQALGIPLVAAAPTRWRLGGRCASDLRDGRWPGSGDRTMARLVREASMFVADADRRVSWA